MGNKIVTEADRKATPKALAPNGRTNTTGRVGDAGRGGVVGDAPRHRFRTAGEEVVHHIEDVGRVDDAVAVGVT